MNSLNSITPIDGRYSNQTQELSKYFSEEALIKNRILIEVHYLLFLFKYKVLNFNLTGDEINYILGLYSYPNLRAQTCAPKLARLNLCAPTCTRQLVRANSCAPT